MLRSYHLPDVVGQLRWAGSYLADLCRLPKLAINDRYVIANHDNHMTIIPHISQSQYDLNHIIPRIPNILSNDALYA